MGAGARDGQGPGVRLVMDARDQGSSGLPGGIQVVGMLYKGSGTLTVDPKSPVT